MKQNYCGNFWSLRTGLIPTGDALKVLFEHNVPVRYRHVWTHILGQGTLFSDWMVAENIIDLAHSEKPDVPDAWKYGYSQEIEYEIPDDVYPIILAEIEKKNEEYDQHWNKVASMPVPEWALGVKEHEEGYIYSNEIAPEREFFNDDYFDIYGEVRGNV
jgi:hypothetical protein